MNRSVGVDAPVGGGMLQRRLQALLETLEHGLVERGRVVRLALLGALAGEHTLLIGPPGTAKSELARRLHRAFAGGQYFERLLTRFTVPEELFGPLSISALEADRYERHTAGYLPEATIAFIDEVFKANSAILNALLTLLNEREFDNGAVRLRCPLISVIGATNTVPDDEVGEAFFDRFLLRLQVEPVSARGFAHLLRLRAPADTPCPGLDEAELRHLQAAAAAVALGEDALALLGELREHLRAGQVHVSDRRWVKIVGLLQMAAASDGRDEIGRWDLWLLPWCVAADAATATQVDDWLCARLGLGPDAEPLRLLRVVEAFEAQLEAEQNANDLDYDESGRLRLGEHEAAIDDAVTDAKGGRHALRMRHTRQRRYGRLHVEARLVQLDLLRDQITAYAGALAAERRLLADQLGASLWVDPAFIERADAQLQATAAELASWQARCEQVRAGFEALPRLLGPDGPIDGPSPEPIDVAGLAEVCSAPLARRAAG